jgi:hypothetical protein
MKVIPNGFRLQGSIVTEFTHFGAVSLLFGK